MKQTNEIERNYYYASCWHGNDNESDAMWKVYIRGNEGIAIRTTFGRLKKALEDAPERLWIGEVKYLHTWEGLPDDPLFHACLRKRKYFAHEKEVRVIWADEDARRSGCTGENGKKVPCDLVTLIEQIRLAPTSAWFKSVIDDILRRYGISVESLPSALD